MDATGEDQGARRPASEHESRHASHHDSLTGATAETAQALWYVAGGRAALRSSELPPLEPGCVRVQALYSGISRGTEALVLDGGVPESEAERMRAPFQEGDFPFPVKYGYASVGRIVAEHPAPDGSPSPAAEAGTKGAHSRLGQIVFSLHPHQSLYDLPLEAAHPVPEAVPARRAILAANMETALNAVWDAGPAPGDHIAVVGAGVVGTLAAWLAAGIPGTRVTLIDTDPAKARLAAALGLPFSDPENARGDNDLVIHASASQAGLQTAIGACGTEATLVELSWYGAQPVTVNLGGAFHSRRLKLVSSQVGGIPPDRAPRWTHARRLATALSLLDDPRLDALLEADCPFEDLPRRLPGLLSPGSGTLCQVVSYPAAGTLVSGRPTTD